MTTTKKKITVENTCDRCGRVWHEEYDPENPDKARSFHAELHDGDEVAVSAGFECLCEGCYNALTGPVERLAKVLERPCPDRRKNSGAKKEEGAE